MQIYEKIKEIFDKSFPRELREDIGFQKIIDTIAYSQEYRLNLELMAQSEIANPRSLKVLLARLLNDGHTLRYAKPLQVSFVVEASGNGNNGSDGVVIDKHSKFSSGSQLLISEQSVKILNGAETRMTAIVATVRKKSITVNQNKDEFITVVPLNCSYLEFVEVQSPELIFSNHFRAKNSNAMISFDTNGMVLLVIRNSKFKINESFNIDVIVTKPNAPREVKRISLIDNPSNVSVMDLVQSRAYTPPMSSKEMRELLLYGGGNNCILTPYDYKRKIKEEIEDIGLINLWLEKDEIKATGKHLAQNINKIFISYLVIGDNLNGNGNKSKRDRIDFLITKLVDKYSLDKAIVFRTPHIIKPTITVTLENYNTETPIPQTLKDEIINKCVGTAKTLNRYEIKKDILKLVYDGIDVVGVDIDVGSSKDVVDEYELPIFYSFVEENIYIIFLDIM